MQRARKRLQVGTVMSGKIKVERIGKKVPINKLDRAPSSSISATIVATATDANVDAIVAATGATAAAAVVE